MDVPLLIAEIHKRPALWDVVHEEHRDRQSVPKLWLEVAEVVGVDVDQCKRKWKNLRDAYRAEIRRSERRIERDKLMGDYDPNTNYNSKWVYFPLMDFIGDNCLRRRCACFKNENANANSNDNNNTNNHQNQDYDNDDDDDVDNDVINDDDEERDYNNSEYNENMNSACDIKSEPSHNNMDSNIRNFHDNANAKQRAQEDEVEATNDMLFEEFQNIATPQAARRLSASLSLNKSLQQNYNTMPQQQQQQQQQQNQNIIPSSSNAINKNNNNNCSKCSQRTVDQVHFLEDLGREEQKLIKSTRQDITRSNNLDHIGDSDYNFLVSFLPQMKKMTELQNLQFRARMCDMVLNIFSPPTTVDNLRAVRSQNLSNVCNTNERQQPMDVVSERSENVCGENSGNIVNSGFFD
ncbi:uncharacterized protein ACRADG_001789 [Cochliomyia hominivorax]